jgi:hypothetical protein
LGFFAAPTVAGLAKGNNEKTNKNMETKTRVIIFNCTAPNIRRRGIVRQMRRLRRGDPDAAALLQRLRPEKLTQ